MGKFAKDSISTSIIIAAGFVFGTLTGMFVYPKLFDKADLGAYRYLNGWGTLFAQFCSFGVGSAAIRIYYRLHNKRAFGELNMLLFLVPLIALVAFLLVFTPLSGFFLEKTLNGLPYEGWAVIMGIVMVTIGLTYIKTYQSVGTLLKKSPAVFLNNEILMKLFILAAFLLFYFHVLDRTGFILALGITFLVQLFALIFIIRTFFRENPMVMPGYEKAKPVLRLSLFCLIDNSASILVAQIDLMMVGALCADSLVRMQEYGMAIQVATVIYLPWRSFSSTSIPFIAEAFAKDNLAVIDNIYKRTSLNLLVFGLGVFTLVFTSINNIIEIIPDNYAIIKYPVLFIGIGKLVDMLASVNGNIISLSPHYRYNLYFSLFMVIMLFLVNWLLIPVYGITGSAIATTISMLMFNFLRSYFLYLKYRIHPFHPKTLQVMFFMGAIFTLGLFFPDLHPSAFISLCIRSAFTAVLIYAYLAIGKPSEDIEKIRLNVLKRLRLVRS